MALSNEARSLLGTIAGGLAGGIGGGKMGFAAGVQTAGAAVDKNNAERTANDREQYTRQVAESLRVEQAKQHSVSAQLQLLGVPGLSPESRTEIARSVALETGLDPERLSIVTSQAMKFTELLSLINSDSVPAAVKEEAWNENAPAYGLDTKTSWASMSSAFVDLTPEEKQLVYEELRTPGGTTDVNRTIRFLAHFNGEGKSITSAQLQALGLHTASGLSIDERLAVISAQNAARLTVSPSDILNFIGKWKERQQILGRSTMTPEQFDAEVGMLMQGLQTMQGVLQNTFGEAANNPLGGNVSGADPTTGRAHQNNKKVLRDRIMNGEIKNYDEAVKKMTENGDMLSPVEQDLVKSWLVEAAKNARESKNGGQ